MNTPKNKTAVSNLLRAGLEEARKVQEIKSVAAPAITNVGSAEQAEEELIINLEEKQENICQKEVVKKGIEHIFADRKINNTEGVRIPSEFHKELKVLAGLSGCTIVQMLGNILEDFLNENQKAISSYKRKMI